MTRSQICNREIRESLRKKEKYTSRRKAFLKIAGEQKRLLLDNKDMAESGRNLQKRL